MIKILYYMAGLLDGEACFRWRKGTGPAIEVSMTDLDTIERIGRILKKKPRGPRQYASNLKPFWTVEIFGAKAIGWMQTLYPLLSARRQTRIREVVGRWKGSPNRGTNSFQTR